MKYCVPLSYNVQIYRYAPHNDVSVNDGGQIRQLSHTIITIVLQGLEYSVQ